MVTCLYGDVKCIGTSHNLAVDILVLMDSLNETKTNDYDAYSDIADAVKELIHTDEEARNTLNSFLVNLHDLL